jgi:homoserine O-acetyltransferase
VAYCNKKLKKEFYTIQGKFNLELGGFLQNPQLAYCTYGNLNAAKDNVVWVFHALTASANAADWWEGMIGEGMVFDPSKDFIICVNILGSCYGSTGPNSINPLTNEPYFYDFPDITIRDIVQSQIELRKHLGIDKIKMAIGGSCGGYQVLEWLMMEPETIENYCVSVTSAKESPWGVAIHTAHRSAMELDKTWGEKHENAGMEGIKAARQIGLLFYRNHEIYHRNQSEDTEDKVNNFKATSYLKYQGKKLADRFAPISYYKLTQILDTHNIARNRFKDIRDALQTIQQKGLVISISSDLLCPPSEQKFLARHLGNAEYREIDSLYGHDGFLLEFQKITNCIKEHFGELF